MLNGGDAEVMWSRCSQLNISFMLLALLFNFELCLFVIQLKNPIIITYTGLYFDIFRNYSIRIHQLLDSSSLIS